MKKEELISILAEWNFWGEGLDIGIKREIYTNPVLEILKSKTNKVVTIFGVRRAGKSYIMRQIAKFLSLEFGKNNVLYVNFEEVRIPKDFSILTKIYEAFDEIIKPNIKPFLLLDEIQEIKGWERFVRSLNEKNQAKIVVTGSSAKLMSEEFATLLSGRDISIEVFPLDFKEFLKFKGMELVDLKEILIHKRKIISELRDYLKFGGFPEVVLEENEKIKNEILKRYFETILLKDVIRKFKIKEVNKLEFLANFYITNISSLISFNKIAKTLNLAVKTVERFSKYLATSRMIFFIPKFSFKIKEKELSPRKVYVIDSGISNIGFKFMENIGKVMENIVAINLISRFKEPLCCVCYFRDYQQHEVDFVIKESLKVKQLVQVTYASERDEIEKRELRALIKASELLKCKNLLCITWDYEGEEEFKGKKIKFLPLWKWLLEK